MAEIVTRAAVPVPRSAASNRFAVLPIYVWLLALVVAPLMMLVVASFWRSDGGAMVAEWNLANYQRVVGSASFQVLVLRTFLTALAAAAIASLIAYPMAYYASQRLPERWKITAVMLVIIPLWVSLLMRVFAWRIILGENGVLNSALVEFGILAEPTTAFLYTRFTVLLTLTYVAIPFVFIAAYSALERIPRSLIEAAEDSGASPWRAFSTVVWPLSRQGAAIGFALAFLLAIGDYITPSMVGGLDGTMLGMIIQSQFGLAGNWPLGSAMAVSMMIIVVAFLAIVAILARSRGILDSSGPVGRAPGRVGRGARARVVAVVAAALFVLPYLFLYMPLVVTALFSFNSSPIQTLPLESFTLKWYIALAQDPAMIDAALRSLMVGLGAVAGALVFGTLFAFVFAYIPMRGRGLLQGFMALPVAMPGVVLGVSLAVFFREIAFPAGILRVIVGHLTFVMPVMMLIVLARLERLDPSYAQASMDLGANRLRTFFHVLLPLIGGALLGGALLGFTLSVDEVIVTLFLAGVDPTLPVYVWNQMRFGFTPSINAIFTLIGLVSLVGVLLASRFLRGGPDADRVSPAGLAV